MGVKKIEIAHLLITEVWERDLTVLTKGRTHSFTQPVGKNDWETFWTQPKIGFSLKMAYFIY